MPRPDQPALAMLPEWSATIATREGFDLNVRPAAPEDEQALADFFGLLSPQDLRFRFLTAMKQVTPGFARELVDIDHTQTENLLAFDDRRQLVATAMIAAPAGTNDAEVAVAVRSDLKGKGIGWSMLDHACDYARSRGFKAVHSVQLSDDRTAIALEQEMGFKAKPCADDMGLTILTRELAER
ncbi:MAG TPA: GNAT family N-acetyltransferase [Sphingomicrobium sp.]